MSPPPTPEHQRLAEAGVPNSHWRRWGPYVSDRAWGTVREDYSADGTAWDHFPHDHARSRAYRWNEDGIAGICDRHQEFCFALALWNGRDPILKERFFGLTGTEGNHGEDVKEYYFYLDSTPTHSYMRMLYKYPQRAYPYADLVATNGRRTSQEPEYELVDTGIFDDHRYFDVFVEYAKAATDDVLMRITVANRGPEAASLHVLPTAWFRNTWSWSADEERPSLHARRTRGRRIRPAGRHADLRHALPATSTARRRCCSPRTTRTRGSCSAWTARRTPRTASTTMSSTATGPPSIPTRAARKLPATTSSPCLPAVRRWCGCASPPTHRDRPPPSPTSTTCATHAGPTPTPSTRRSSRTTSRPMPRR